MHDARIRRAVSPVEAPHPIHGTQGRTVLIAAGMLVVACAVSAGLFARLDGLGSRPLAVDEYYFVQSVHHILQEGVPKFSTGGYYTRGLIPQYLAAASIAMFGDNGFAYRLPSVLFGLASIILLFVYGRGIVGGVLATALAVILLVSSWQIEFARFARMYAAFQCLTLVFLIAMHWAFFTSRWHLRYLPHGIVLVATCTHELGVLLVPLLFLPLLFRQDSTRFPAMVHKLRFGCVGILTAAVCATLVKFPFRNYGVADPFPHGFVPYQPPTFRLPSFPFWSMSEGPLVDLALVCGVLLCAVVVLLTLRRRGWKVTDVDIVLAVLLISATCHMLLIALFCVVILLFRYQVYHYREHPVRTYGMIGGAAIIGIGWMVFADWFLRVDGGEFGLLWAFRRTFFGWPDFYSSLYIPWHQELPLLGAIFLGAVGYQIATKLKDPIVSLVQNPTFIVLYIVFCMGIVSFLYRQRRSRGRDVPPSTPVQTGS